MNLNIKTTKDIEEIANFVAESLNRELGLGKRVLWFVTGGSSINVQSKVANKIKTDLPGKLIITMTDERFGPVNHPDSNWYRLVKNGFNIPGAIFIPILVGEGIISTTQKFNIVLDQQLKIADYKIGLFGIGKDGHTAGILPESVAVLSQDLATNYATPIFVRITITPKTIEKLDEAVVWMQGEDKWQVVKDLIEKDIKIIKQPAQILKKVPLLTIFTDYKKE